MESASCASYSALHAVWHHMRKRCWCKVDLPCTWGCVLVLLVEAHDSICTDSTWSQHWRFRLHTKVHTSRVSPRAVGVRLCNELLCKGLRLL